MDLSGKVALITGGGTGMGAAIAKRIIRLVGDRFARQLDNL
jgi:NAD(P)-dependent dehydrogenase (short-subunit alcohol dehydrogenase family)